MMTFSKIISTVVVAGLLGGGLAGCKKNEPIVEKGPAEQAGQKLDQAASKAGEEINKAASAAGKKIQEAGEKSRMRPRTRRNPSVRIPVVSGHAIA
ncbi:hypothetical protein ACFQAT_22865 [Undibacterium arcticum]|uniref:hypothetical protein n=1 Tax=Undibacterium arcticum TaxID=1762892 RepID=UPI0036159526